MQWFQEEGYEIVEVSAGCGRPIPRAVNGLDGPFKKISDDGLRVFAGYYLALEV